MNFVILHYFSLFQCCHLAVYRLKYTNTRSCHFQDGCRAKMKKIGELLPMHVLIYLVPLLAIAALAFAAYKANYVSKTAPGSSRMQEISSAIAEGASAFLKSEYKILAVFILVLFILIAVFINFATALCFVVGAGCSILAGFFGMRVATKAIDGAACLVSPDGVSSSMEKLMRVMQKSDGIPQKILELNPDHALVRALMHICKSGADDDTFKDMVNTLFDTTLLLDGYMNEPFAMAERNMRLLRQAAGWYSDLRK